MADRTFGPYPGLAIVGGGAVAGLYGVNGGLVDAQGTGLQHCFAGDYRHDLIHTATTLLRCPDGRVVYGNRLDDGLSHPVHLRPERVFNRDGYAWGSTFREPAVRTEVVAASGPGCISFACTVEGPFEGDVMALVVFRGYPGAACRITPGGADWDGPESKRLSLRVEGESSPFALTADSPSGFLYRTVQSLRDPEAPPPVLQTAQPIGLAVGRSVSLAPGQSCCLRWHLLAPDAVPGDAEAFWEPWYAAGAPVTLPDPAMAHYYRANLAALRGAVMGGFVPADMTGQYFAGGAPSYYARDSLMIARALLLSGHYPEFRAIVRYLAARPAKRGGEFCQRYNAAGEPSEGQHNGVPHQLDSQGYFVWNVVEYYRRTGEWIVPFEQIAAVLDALADCIGPQSMAGPEGGVNEGVFGPAYITSSNMFIYGGLAAGIEAARALGRPAEAERWLGLQARIGEGIEAAWDEALGRYSYGFVTYDHRPVRKYDAPQYFGPLYGFPLTERMLRNDRFLRRHAAFFGDGIGYSEQEYHHGPWIFNTAACAQFQVLAANEAEYRAKLCWLMAHANQFGLMPEAIDADDESRCFVNPLVWGCAEAVSTVAFGHAASRGGKTNE